MCKVSVIIPVYGTEKYLPDCLNSVLGQTETDLEVICIDDCSPDRCGEILDAYAKKDSRVRVFHLPENKRQGYGRNLGMDHANGEYFYFLDSDDMIMPETLAELIRRAEAEHADVIFFDAQDVFESEEIRKIYTPQIATRSGRYPEGAVPGTDLFDCFIKEGEWTCHPQMSFWRTAFIREAKVRYLEGTVHEDEYFAFAGILLAERALYIRKPYFIRRTRAASVMTSPPAPKNFYGYLRNYFLMNRLLAEKNIRTDGAVLNIFRIYDRARTMYDLLHEKYDLREICSRTAEDRLLYEFFLSRIEYEEKGAQMYEPTVRRVRLYRRAWIYGAGIVGKRVQRRLVAENDIVVAGFLVTEKNANTPAVIRGMQVFGIDEAEIREDDILVIACGPALYPQMRAEAEKRGLPFVYHTREPGIL